LTSQPESPPPFFSPLFLFFFPSLFLGILRVVVVSVEGGETSLSFSVFFFFFPSFLFFFAVPVDADGWAPSDEVENGCGFSPFSLPFFFFFSLPPLLHPSFCPHILARQHRRGKRQRNSWARHLPFFSFLLFLFLLFPPSTLVVASSSPVLLKITPRLFPLSFFPFSFSPTGHF